MDVEFHYHVTYLIAARAGYSSAQAETIAHSSQLVDDNNAVYRVGDYSNYVSQTANILKPRFDLLRIYPLFHFIPGDPLSAKARRKDGKMHLLNVTPGSSNAINIFEAAKRTGNLYALGIACHAYADTFAHQNFTGYYEDFNAMAGVLENLTPDIGHADALTKPDEIGLTWIDPRLIDEERDNNRIFLDATEALFMILGGRSDMLNGLLFDLSDMFSLPNAAKRADFARALSRRVAYGGEQIPEYRSEDWLNWCSRKKMFGRVQLPGFEDSDWYKFQEAVKWYQNTAWSILKSAVFDKMDLRKL